MSVLQDLLSLQAPVKLDEMALEAASALKVKRLKEILTPENIATHYEKVINALAYKLTLDDINDLTADISGKAMGADEIKFQLQMMVKKLPKATKAVIDSIGNRINGNIPGVIVTSEWEDDEDTQATFWIVYQKGKWKVSIYNAKSYNSAEHKAFEADQSVEALDYLLKQLQKRSK